MNEDQKKMLYLLHDNKSNDVGAMSEMHIGNRSFYQTKKELYLKVLKVLLEKQINE